MGQIPVDLAVSVRLRYPRLLVALVTALAVILVLHLWWGGNTIRVGREIIILDDTHHPALVENVRAYVEEKYHLPVRVIANPFTLDYAYHPIRDQYDYTRIRARTAPYIVGDQGKVILLTDKDTFGMNLNWSTGYSMFDGNLVIVSLHRLDPQFWTGTPDPALFQARARKIVIHELGHSYGIYSHCRNWSCCMSVTDSIVDIDAIGTDYYGGCRERLYLKAELQGRFEDIIAGHLRLICATPRPNGSPELARARQYVAEQVAKWRYQVTADTFHYDGRELQNLVAVRTGATRPNDYLVLSAHLDTVEGTVGADDNGAGVAVLLLLAEELSYLQLDCSVALVFISGEELGMIGSRRFLAEAKRQGWNLTGAVVLDQAGYDSDHRPIFLIHDGATGRPLAATLERVTRGGGIALEPKIMGTGSYPTSDAVNFWRAGVPAITLTEDFTGDYCRAYHTPADTIEQVNLDYVGKLTRAVLRLVAEVATSDAEMAPPAAAAPGPRDADTL